MYFPLNITHYLTVDIRKPLQCVYVRLQLRQITHTLTGAMLIIRNRYVG